MGEEASVDSHSIPLSTAGITEFLPTDVSMKKSAPTSAELAKLRILVKNPPPNPASPQLLVLKQKERSHLLQLTASSQLDWQPCVKLPKSDVKEFRSAEDMESKLRLTAVTTPATGNCMEMAIVQALCDSDLAAQDMKLAEATGSLKRGIKYSGQMHLAEEFPQNTRVATLIGVQHGWEGMDLIPAKKQFKWYLEEFSKSPSDRHADVHVHNWGGAEKRSLWRQIFYVVIFMLSRRQCMEVEIGNAVCIGRALSVEETK